MFFRCSWWGVSSAMWPSLSDSFANDKVVWDTGVSDLAIPYYIWVELWSVFPKCRSTQFESQWLGWECCVCSHAWKTWSWWDHNQATFIDCPLQWKGGLKAASVDRFSPKHMPIQITHTIAKKQRHGFPLPWKRLKSDILQISNTKQKLHGLKLLVLLEWKKSYKLKLWDLHCQVTHSLWMMWPPHPTAPIR